MIVFAFALFDRSSHICTSSFCSAKQSHYRGQPKAGTGHKMLSVPFVFSTSRFQGPAFGCDKIVVIVTLLEAIEGIPHKDYNFLGNDKFTRDCFMSENLRANI